MTTADAMIHQKRKYKTLPFLVVMQLLIAITTVVVMLAVSLKIKPLIEKKNSLEKEIQILDEELNKQKEKLRATQILTENLLKSSGLQEIRSSSVSKLYEEKQGSVVVLGSYKDLEEAISGIKNLQKRLPSYNLKLYFAVNNYYAAVIGIIEDSSIAFSTLKKVRSVVQDAYIFDSWAFPYEIKFQLP